MIVLEKETALLNHWPGSEEKHYPLSIQEARKHLNIHTKQKLLSNLVPDAPIFAICNGFDQEKTVAIGNRCYKTQFSRYLITAEGYFDATDSKVKVQSMRDDHLKRIRNKNVKIDVAVKGIFCLYGEKIIHISSCLQYPGSILLEADWKGLSYEVPARSIQKLVRELFC